MRFSLALSWTLQATYKLSHTHCYILLCTFHSLFFFVSSSFPLDDWSASSMHHGASHVPHDSLLCWYEKRNCGIVLAIRIPYGSSAKVYQKKKQSKIKKNNKKVKKARAAEIFMPGEPRAALVCTCSGAHHATENSRAATLPFYFVE